MNQELKARMDAMYKAVLVDRDVSKFYDFFAVGCSVNINGTVFDDQAFLQRIKWLRDNLQEVKVDVLDCFQSESGDRVTDLHLSSVLDNKGVHHVVLVMQQSVLNKDGKIEKFFDISRILSDDQTTNVHIAK